MRNVSVLLAATLLSLAALGSPSIAAVTDKALAAMKQGDFKTALDELRPLAAKSDPNAQFLLGMMYDAGNGVAQDQAAAAAWYRKAAKQDHLLAQLFLGVLLYSGQGVRQDYAEAARWFKTPADSGNDQAQFYLGSMYASGTGVKKDGSEAIRWLAKSAAQRNTRAMGMLATELFSRSRDDQDRVDAYAWSHLAAELDPVQAMTSARTVIEQYCTREQATRGKALMAEWKRKWSGEAKTRPSGR
jgi:hypothetical protein